MKQSRLVLSRHLLPRLALSFALALAAMGMGAASLAQAQSSSTRSFTSASADAATVTKSLIGELTSTMASQKALVNERENAVTPFATTGKPTDISAGETYQETLTGAAERTYQITLSEPDLVGIKLSASGTSSEANGSVGLVTIYESEKDHIDVITLYEDETEECWYYLPAGTYRLLYLQMGTDGEREVSLYWEQEGLDLSPEQVVSPRHRTFDDPANVPTDTKIFGTFYWGFSHSNDSYLDGHYYEFTLSHTAKVSLVLGTSSPARVALLDDEGNIALDTEGIPLAYSGDTHGFVQCGTLKAGTYRFLVITSDSASWRHSFTVEVLTSLTDTTARFGTDVYRLYNESTHEHLFTISSSEKSRLLNNGWKNEGVSWVAPESSSDVVWRLLNPYTGEHLYTNDATERAALLTSGWEDEDVAWYSDPAERVAVYRLFNPYAEEIAAHHYTTDRNEYEQLASLGWQQEGECWYGMR